MNPINIYDKDTKELITEIIVEANCSFNSLFSSVIAQDENDMLFAYNIFQLAFLLSLLMVLQ